MGKRSRQTFHQMRNTMVSKHMKTVQHHVWLGTENSNNDTPPHVLKWMKPKYRDH